jgi:hypothetical protein
VTIDPKLLPARALFDTSVFVRGIRQISDSNTDICHDLFKAMVKADKQILIAAPTIAEVLRYRGAGKKPIPQYAQIEPGPFDDVCAELLGDKLPMPVLDEVNSVKAYGRVEG